MRVRRAEKEELSGDRGEKGRQTEKKERLLVRTRKKMLLISTWCSQGIRKGRKRKKNRGEEFRRVCLEGEILPGEDRLSASSLCEEGGKERHFPLGEEKGTTVSISLRECRDAGLARGKKGKSIPVMSTRGGEKAVFRKESSTT